MAPVLFLVACVVPIESPPVGQTAPPPGSGPRHGYPPPGNVPPGPGAGPGYPPPPGNLPQRGRRPLDLTHWRSGYTGRGLVRLDTGRRYGAAPVFHFSSDRPSTAWVGSPPFHVGLPYRVTFWVGVSRRPYNGFTIYDAIDATGRRTDIQVYLHDDQDDHTAEGGWHGELWVKDAVGRYSIAPVPRGHWVRFALARRTDGMVELFMNGRRLGTFVSRSPRPVARIEPIGDTDERWWLGEAGWGPVTIF